MENTLLRKPGVYCIKNLVSGKEYVGSSAKNIHRRLGNHFTALKRGYHANRHLVNAFNKYGKDGFIAKCLIYCEPSDVLKYEQFWIDKKDSYNNGYNQRPIAKNNTGLKLTAETRRKIGNAGRGRKHTKRQNEKCLNWLRGAYVLLKQEEKYQ